MEKKVKDIATFNLAILATMGNYQSLVWRNDNKWKDEKEKLDKEISPLGQFSDKIILDFSFTIAILTKFQICMFQEFLKSKSNNEVYIYFFFIHRAIS